MILDANESTITIPPVLTKSHVSSPESATVDVLTDFSSEHSGHDDSRDAPSAATSSVGSYSQEEDQDFTSHEDQVYQKDTTLDREVDVYDRLYNETKPKQADGKQRRLEIERMLAKRRELPAILSANKKIPLSQAEDFYRKSVMWAMEKEERLAAVASESGRKYEYLYNFKTSEAD